MIGRVGRLGDKRAEEWVGEIETPYEPKPSVLWCRPIGLSTRCVDLYLVAVAVKLVDQNPKEQRATKVQ